MIHRCTGPAIGARKKAGNIVCDGRISAIQHNKDGGPLKTDYVCERCKKVWTGKELALITMAAARQALQSVEAFRPELLDRVNRLIEDVRTDRITPEDGESQVFKLEDQATGPAPMKIPRVH